MKWMKAPWAVCTAALAVLILGSGVVVAGFNGHGHPGAESGVAFFARVTGGQEVPPVHTRARSIGTFRFTPGDAAFVGVRFNFNHDQDVTDVHIHEGAFGEDGPIILNMRPVTPEEGVCIDLLGGLLTYYFLTKEALRGSLAGMTLTDLKAVMVTGGTYINLHTPENPTGWIRGQMIPRRETAH